MRLVSTKRQRGRLIGSLHRYPSFRVRCGGTIAMWALLVAELTGPGAPRLVEINRPVKGGPGLSALTGIADGT
jgi:hypothetical protein